jgi:hypothetical protein
MLRINLLEELVTFNSLLKAGYFFTAQQARLHRGMGEFDLGAVQSASISAKQQATWEAHLRPRIEVSFGGDAGTLRRLACRRPSTCLLSAEVSDAGILQAELGAGCSKISR